MDRDIKSAICIKNEGLKQVPMDCKEVKLEENLSSTFMNKLSKISYVYASKMNSLSQEAPPFAVG